MIAVIKQGFTLIELLVTIMVVAIIAIVAIPKLISPNAEAQAALVDATMASFKTSLSQFNQRWNIDNESTDPINFNNLETSVYPSSWGYPGSQRANVNRRDNMRQIDCETIWPLLIDTDFTIDTNNPNTDQQINNRVNNGRITQDVVSRRYNGSGGEPDWCQYTFVYQKPNCGQLAPRFLYYLDGKMEKLPDYVLQC